MMYSKVMKNKEDHTKGCVRVNTSEVIHSCKCFEAFFSHKVC